GCSCGPHPFLRRPVTEHDLEADHRPVRLVAAHPRNLPVLFELGPARVLSLFLLPLLDSSLFLFFAVLLEFAARGVDPAFKLRNRREAVRTGRDSGSERRETTSTGRDAENRFVAAVLDGFPFQRPLNVVLKERVQASGVIKMVQNVKVGFSAVRTARAAEHLAPETFARCGAGSDDTGTTRMIPPIGHQTNIRDDRKGPMVKLTPHAFPFRIRGVSIDISTWNSCTTKFLGNLARMMLRDAKRNRLAVRRKPLPLLHNIAD